MGHRARTEAGPPRAQAALTLAVLFALMVVLDRTFDSLVVIAGWGSPSGRSPSRKPGARTHEALLEAMEEALSKVSAADAAGWFEHCGYQVEVQYL